MLPQNNPDRTRIVFDDHRLVANAGLLLPATLAQHLGLRELVDRHLDLGGAPGRANTGDKLLTLVASALAGGDCIDDADALRAGGTARVLGCVVKAPSTLGTFLRSFSWGHVRQLDRVSRQLLARAWQAGAGPGDAPLTIILTSNKSFGEWGELLGDTVIISAVLDRLLHHSHMLTIRGGELQAQGETPGGTLPVATASRRFARGGRRQLRGLTKSQTRTRWVNFKLLQKAAREWG